MKRIITILILLMFLNINAQINPIKDALNYYPLHVGDYWQYQMIKQKFGVIPQKDTSIIYKEVIGDTLMPNSKEYFIVTELFAYPPKRYLRIDSTNTILYEYDGNIERGIDSLLFKQGDRFGDNTCLSETVQEYFGNYVNTKTIIYGPFSSGQHGYDLAYGLGEVSRFYNADAGSDSYLSELIYAKIGGTEYGIKTDVEIAEELPSQIKLFQNYPNPFNPTTSIKYSIPQQAVVSLSIYDLLGREVAILVNEEKPPGNYEIKFNVETFHGTSLPSGVYFYRLQASSFSTTKKFILMK